MKGLIIGDKEHGLIAEALKPVQLESGEIEWDHSNVNVKEREGREELLKYDVSLLQGDACLYANQSVKKRSVGSHFLNYIDLVTRESGELWGHSLFSTVFREVLLKSIENQDFKGAVIFLGHSPQALPIIQVLAGFGFEDFVFLQHQETEFDFGLFQSQVTGLIGTKVSKVDSTAFIQSQKEYSFCFVMEDFYSEQTLEDMSYFHFLSSQSMVFDLSGKSNFLFKEVKALGVNVTDFGSIQQVWGGHLRDKLKDIASKIS